MNVVCYIGSAEPLCCDTLKTHLGACVPNECIHAFDDFEGMLQAVKSASGRAVLFADRYFFGFHMENQMYRLLLANPLTDVVIVSEKALEKVFVLRLHNMGAQAVLEGIFSAPGIANDIVQVLNGAKLLPERVADAVRNGETRNWAKLYSPPAMREYMVLCLQAAGFSQKEIEAYTGFSRTLVATYTERLRCKLGARTTAEAVRIWLRTRTLSHLEDDCYESVSGWNLQQGVFGEPGGVETAACRKMPERKSGRDCRHLQERARECGVGRFFTHDPKHKRSGPRRRAN